MEGFTGKQATKPTEIYELLIYELIHELLIMHYAYIHACRYMQICNSTYVCVRTLCQMIQSQISLILSSAYDFESHQTFKAVIRLVSGFGTREFMEFKSVRGTP